jgi:hypothetical protein
VVAVDQSAIGLEKPRKLAAEHGVTIDTRVSDLGSDAHRVDARRRGSTERCILPLHGKTFGYCSGRRSRLAVESARSYTTPMADAAKDATGTLQGKTITLDEAVPALEGRRVHVLIEPVVEDQQLSHKENLENCRLSSIRARLAPPLLLQWA